MHRRESALHDLLQSWVKTTGTRYSSEFTRTFHVIIVAPEI